MNLTPKQKTAIIAAIATAIVTILTTLFATDTVDAAATSEPKWGTRPTIGQRADELYLVDRGDWFTQESSRPTRTCVQWLRDTGGGWEVVGGGRAPKRTPLADVLPCESATSLRIGAENVGRRFRALVGAGVPFYGWGDEPLDWTEWGYLQANDSGQEAYSNDLHVAPWQDPAETPPLCTPESTPAGCTPDVAQARALLREQLLQARAQGQTWPTLKPTPTYRAWRYLGGR